MRKIIVVIIIICGIAHLASGQAEVSVVTVDQPVVAENPFAAHGYKSDEISARLKGLETRSDIAQADKDKLTRLYTDSLDLVREIETLAGLNTDYESRIKKAPEELENIKKLLADGVLSTPLDDAGLTTLEQAEQKLAGLQLELSQVQKDNATLANEPQRRVTRRNEIPVEVAALNEKLLKYTDKGYETGSEVLLDEVRQATVMYNTLAKDAMKSKVRTLESELAMYNARSELLSSQREYYDKKQQALSEQVKFWQEKVTNRRKDQAQEAKNQAQTAVSEVGTTHKILEDISKDNLDIAEVQRKLVDKIEHAGKEQKAIEDELKELQIELDRMVKMVNEVGLSSAIGILLHSKLVNLPDTNVNKQNLKKRLIEMSQSQFELLDHDEKYARLNAISNVVSELMLSQNMPEGPAKRELSAKVEELLTAQRNSLETLVNYYYNYTAILATIDVKEREYVNKVSEYRNFIDEHILWVKNTQPISLEGISQIGPEMNQIFSIVNWREVIVAIPNGVVQELSGSILLWLILLAVYLARFGNRRRLRQLAAKVALPEHDKYSYTLIALLITVIYSLPLPLTLYVVGRAIEYGSGGMEFAGALAGSLISLSFYDFVMLPLRNVFMREGLAVSHFNLSSEKARFFYSFSSWFIIILQPLLFMLYVQHNLEGAYWNYQFSRLVFIAIMLLFSIYLAIIFYPGRNMSADKQGEKEKFSLFHYRNMIYMLSILIPLILAVMAWQGYFYAAWLLEVRMFTAFWAAMVFILLNSLVVRRIYLARGNILASHVGKKESGKKPNTELADDEDVSAEEVDMYCGQITRFVRFALSFAYLLSLFVIFKDVFPALAVLNNIELWEVADGTDGKKWITLASMLSALTILTITILMARNITGLINITLLKSISHKEGTRFAVLALIRYFIVIFGVCWSFTKIGIGWDKVQWLAAAFTVGLGFGLQEIFANFVSGIILLFEQPMRVGDIVTVGEVSGRVTHINTRSTTINCWDRRELIIPNKEFITGKLMNWTLSDNLNRIVFSIGVAYGSNIDKVEKTLMRIGRFQKGVVWKPKPQVIFKGFGQSTLDFDLRVYIDDMDNYVDVWHGINCAIDAEFRKEGIEIAFPQHDLHIRSIDCGPLPVRIDRSSGNSKSAGADIKLEIKEEPDDE